MNRNIPLALLVLVAVTPGVVFADGAQSPRAKVAPAKSVKAEASATPERAVEAGGRPELVTPQPRFKPRGVGSDLRSGVQPSAPRSYGRTTIAPFPVPGDTSRVAKERWKTLNLPKSGVTTIAPLPIPPGAVWDPYGVGVVPPQQIDVFPEARFTVPPSYPEAARDAGIQGTVRVGAHVGTDGIVDSVSIIQSIAGLDSTAMACVKQWRFKPASYQGRPVAVWVGIPVKFTLH